MAAFDWPNGRSSWSLVFLKPEFVAPLGIKGTHVEKLSIQGGLYDLECPSKQDFLIKGTSEETLICILIRQVDPYDF